MGYLIVLRSDQEMIWKVGVCKSKIQQEVTFKHYNYQEEVLNYTRALVPNDVKVKF